MNKYNLKIGDKVLIKTWERMAVEYDVDSEGDIINDVERGDYYSKGERVFCGEIVTVRKKLDSSFFLAEDQYAELYFWSIEKVVTEEIKQYRIKTEQEFVDEFGADWCGNFVAWSRAGVMNNLFGLSLSHEKVDRIDGWHIYPNMITDKPLPVENKDVSQFKVGDKVWVEAEIWYIDSTESQITILESNGHKEHVVVKKENLYKTLPADQQTIYNVKDHLISHKCVDAANLDSLSHVSPDCTVDPSKAFSHLTNTMYHREPKAAIMLDGCDMSEEIKDEHIWSGRDNRNRVGDEEEKKKLEQRIKELTQQTNNRRVNNGK